MPAAEPDSVPDCAACSAVCDSVASGSAVSDLTVSDLTVEFDSTGTGSSKPFSIKTRSTKSCPSKSRLSKSRLADSCSASFRAAESDRAKQSLFPALFSALKPAFIFSPLSALPLIRAASLEQNPCQNRYKTYILHKKPAQKPSAVSRVLFCFPGVFPPFLFFRFAPFLFRCLF